MPPLNERPRNEQEQPNGSIRGSSPKKRHVEGYEPLRNYIDLAERRLRNL